MSARGSFGERVAAYGLLAAALEDASSGRLERASDREEVAEHLLERAPRADHVRAVRRAAGL